MGIVLSLIGAIPPEVHQALRAVDWGRRPPEARAAGSRSPLGLFRALKLKELIEKIPEPTKADYIIGDTPGETLRVSDTWEWFGNVYVINDGVLLVEGGEAIIHGNVVLLQEGKVLVYDGTLTFPQIFTYQYYLFALDSSTWEMKRAVLRLGGWAFTGAAAIKAKVVFDTLTITEGWLTQGMYWGATGLVRQVNCAGEWIIFDSVQAQFVNVDTLLTWFSFRAGDTANFSWPSWDNLEHFEIRDGLPGFSGVDYWVTLDTIGLAMLGLMPDSGSWVELWDSKIRSVGIMGFSSDSQDISGLINDATFSDFTLPMTDRHFRITNTYVRTWSLYPANGFTLTFRGSIVGEVLSMDTSYCWGENYFLDGSGGHFEASGRSFNVAVYSAVTAEAYTSEHGIGLWILVSVPWGRIWAKDSSRFIIAQSQFPEKPRAYDAAAVYVLSVDEPTVAPTGSIVPLVGSATIIEGPESPWHFSHYNVYWAPAEDTSTWHPIDNPHTTPVYKDTLAYWDARGLPEGDYSVKLVLWDESDSLSIVVGVRLQDMAQEEGSREDSPALWVWGRQITLSIPSQGNVVLEAYDPSGRLVETLYRGQLATGKHRFIVSLRPGTYVLKLSGDYNLRKTVVIR